MTIKKETIIRTIVLVIALVNQILTSTGHSVLPVNSEELAELFTLLFTIGASIWAWWKNNSFTKNAIEADEYLDKKRNAESEVVDYE